MWLKSDYLSDANIGIEILSFKCDAKIVYLAERFSKWTTFVVLIFVNRMIINILAKRFGKLFKYKDFSCFLI